VGSEIGSNRRWNEPLLKRLTGGDPISARYTGKDFFEFNPTHTLIIFANSKPSLRVVDEAIKARIQFVPFTEIIPEAERDTALPEKLKAEYGGILQWAIEGCLDWLQRGLDPPLTVRDASDAYLESEDHIQQWMNERCKTEGSIRLAEAYLSYKLWCNDNSAAQLGRNTFADQLAARDGVQRSQRGAKTVSFSGLSLKDFRERDIDA
jgi:putative DNA primase/helicase